MSGMIRHFRGDFVFRPVVIWPGEKTPDSQRKRNPFGKATYEDTLTVLGRELGALDAKRPVIQLYLPESKIRIDGLPYSGASPSEPGVILAFDSKWGPLSYPCDTFNHWRTNLRAIALAMESLRRVDRYGVSRRGQQYTGWKALPGSTQQTVTPGEAAATIAMWSEVEVADILAAPDSARSAIRVAIRATHPDRNDGAREAYDQVDAARKALTVHHGVSV
jgi:hypothetical protein